MTAVDGLGFHVRLKTPDGVMRGEQINCWYQLLRPNWQNSLHSVPAKIYPPLNTCSSPRR